MSSVYISIINPIKYSIIKTANPLYNSRHLDDYEFKDTVLPFQQPVPFYQPWQLNDTIHQQLIASTGPITLKVVDLEGNEVYSSNFIQKQEHKYLPGFFIYEHTLSLSIFSEGAYRMKLYIGTEIWQSELLVFSTKIDRSLLVEYKHYEYFSGVIFETGFYPSIRVPGTLVYQKPANKRTIYEDQPLNTTTLKSSPYRLFKLYVGNEEGVPDYIIDLFNSISGCSTLSIEGRLYTINDGASFEDSAEDGYPMRGWSVELREQLNRGMRVYDGITPNLGISVIATVDSKGFGNSQGGAEFQIQDFN